MKILILLALVSACATQVVRRVKRIRNDLNILQTIGLRDYR